MRRLRPVALLILLRTSLGFIRTPLLIRLKCISTAKAKAYSAFAQLARQISYAFHPHIRRVSGSPSIIASARSIAAGSAGQWSGAAQEMEQTPPDRRGQVGEHVLSFTLIPL